MIIPAPGGRANITLHLSGRLVVICAAGTPSSDGGMTEQQQTAQAHAADLALARAVLAGDDAAWQRLVTDHSGIVIAILRRYLHDRDEIRTVYVDVLAQLRQGTLAAFAGRSSLSTWLACVARGAAVDHLRHLHGRREDPTAVADLDERQREVFRLYYVEGRAFEDVRMRLHQRGMLADGTSLAEILAEIDARLQHRTARRLAWDLHATSVGAASGRLLEYLDHAAGEAAEAAASRQPDAALIAAEARRNVSRILALVDKLPEAERTILKLRFEAGLTAEQIAEELGGRFAVGGRRRVYTLLDRALARLRRWAEGQEKS